jgi:hypothetical protein
LQHNCTGLVLLTADQSENFLLLSNCLGGIVAEDEVHARQLRRIVERPFPGPAVRHAA